MTTFLDSSAAVKLYAEEPGGESVAPVETAFISSLTRVEVPAAFWRKQRLGELTAEMASALGREFERDFRGEGDAAPRFAVVKVGTYIVNRAARLVAAHPLRSSDAIQLATALAIRELEPDCRTLACFDKQLRAAAAAHGFELVP